MQFRFATDILRRLGEELNPNIDSGLIELVKNAYDADARSCVVTLEGTDVPGGKISIKDDGDGMTAEDIANGFLVVGSSIKEPNRPTRLGRVPSGSKGLGRLAALRLGDSVQLVTRPLNETGSEYELNIDWKAFRGSTLVEDVELDLKKTSRPTGSVPGTELCIRDVHARMGRSEVKRLARALILLADPFDQDSAGFRPRLESSEYQDLQALVSNRYFRDADFHLSATVDEAGVASAKVLDFKGETLFTAEHSDIALGRDGKPYGCPAAQFDLWAFRLSAEVFRMRETTIQEVRDWLEAFGGVHVYVNQLRVTPYGNAGDDWLEINLRRVRNPEERPGTNTSIGRMVVRDEGHQLVEKTDRSGFIENEAFLELRAFGQDAMEFMARRRLGVAEQKRAADRAKTEKTASRSRARMEKAIQQVRPRQREALTTAFTQYERAREREMSSLKREVQLYRTLSTAGITAALFAHESSGSPIKVIQQAIGSIERRAREALNARYDPLLGRPVAMIRGALASLSVLSTTTLRLIDHDKRRLGRVEINGIVRSVVDTFNPFFTGRDVKIELSLSPGSPYLRASEAAIESIVTNLINNSLAAFERGGSRNRRIVITTRISGSRLILMVSDSGPGIADVSIEDIWLPGVTTQPNGTGLGLTIVRDAVADLGGNVAAVAKGPHGGAEVSITLPLLGK